MGYFFLVVFQPFGAYTYTNRYKYLLMVPYSAIAFVVYSTANLIFKKSSYNWSIYKELTKLFFILIACSILNYIYNIYFINHVAFSIRHLLLMFLYTFAIAVPVSMVYLLGRYLYLTRYWEAAVETIDEPRPGKMLLIVPDSGTGQLSIHENDFLFAESEGNYSTIYYLQQNIIHKKLLRLSLKNIEDNVGSGSIIRCHRSYIINTNKIQKVKGNAQGYKLFIEGHDAFIPVSRNYITELKAKLKVL